MPDAKYYDRSSLGVGKNNLGWDNEDLPSQIKPSGEEVKTIAMPSEPTQDKQVNQDGNVGKPFFKTLEERRGKSDSSSSSHAGYGGPNAQ